MSDELLRCEECNFPVCKEIQPGLFELRYRSLYWPMDEQGKILPDAKPKKRETRAEVIAGNIYCSKCGHKQCIPPMLGAKNGRARASDRGTRDRTGDRSRDRTGA